jgi:hypothetical protein
VDTADPLHERIEEVMVQEDDATGSDRGPT